MNPQTQTTTGNSTPKTHEHDSVAVTNIDLNCHETTTYTAERTISVEPIAGETNPLQIPRFRSQMEEGEFEHDQYFEVRYNGQPFRLTPGETKILPRYIAEHFAKHLADHMLQKMEAEEERKAIKEKRSPRKGYVQSALERPKMLTQILKTESYFLQGQQSEPSPNQTPDMPGTQDLGQVPNYAVGKLVPQPKTAEQILEEANAEHTISRPMPAVDPLPPEPATTAASAPSGLPPLPQANIDDTQAKAELVKEAVNLDIPITGHESADELKQKIASF